MTDHDNGWLGVKRESRPGPETPHPGPLYGTDGQPRPPRNPHPPDTFAHALAELRLACADLAAAYLDAGLDAGRRIAYRVQRATRRER